MNKRQGGRVFMKVRLPDFAETLKNDPEVNWGVFSWLEEHVESSLSVPAGFVVVAEDGTGGGLAVTKAGDNILYRLEEGEISAYALSEAELRLALYRDEVWEELAENMPASRPYWLGMVLKAKRNDGTELTLGFPGLKRQSAMVIRGRVETDDVLTDALNRELGTALGLDDYAVLDLIDEGGLVEENETQVPMFTVVLEVEAFDVKEKIGDPTVGWLSEEKKKRVDN
jgi:hypothetical protein